MATYLVTDKDAPEGTLPKMVECRAKSQAISAVAGERFTATPLSTKEAVTWAKQGVELLDLSEQAEGGDAE